VPKVNQKLSEKPESERVSASSLAEALFKVGALRFGRIRLPNGKVSPYDLDLRLVPSYPEIYTTVLAAYVELMEGIGEGAYDVIAGVATAGVTISAPLAVMLRKPMVYVRKEEEKNRGPGKLVEGAAERGSRVLIIDDLVSTGRSVALAAAALKREGYRTRDVAVMVDRLEGGRQYLAANGLELKSFTNIGDLVKALHRSKLVTKARVEEVMRMARTPSP
jgi:orotate phosphoribosyltransferase